MLRIFRFLAGLSLPAAAALALLAAGCDENLKPSEENFAKAINLALSRRPAVIPVPGVPSQANDDTAVIEDLEQTLERRMTPEERTRFRRQLNYAKLLQSAGMAIITHETYTQMRGNRQVNLWGYVISFNSRYSSDIRRFGNGKIGLLAGRIGVDRIMRFSEPKTEDGVTYCDVTYTRAVVNRPEWATDAVIDYSGIRNYIRGQQTIRLVLREKGWVVDNLGGPGQEPRRLRRVARH